MRLLSSLLLAAVMSASLFGSAAQQSPGTIPPSANPFSHPGPIAKIARNEP